MNKTQTVRLLKMIRNPQLKLQFQFYKTRLPIHGNYHSAVNVADFAWSVKQSKCCKTCRAAICRETANTPVERQNQL